MKNTLITIAAIVIIVAVGGYLVVTNYSNPVVQAPALTDQNPSNAVAQETNSNTQTTNNGKTSVKSNGSNAVNTTSVTPSTTLSSTDMCQKYAQEVADSSGAATNQYYSVQSYHYSNLDNACYFVLHYQMNLNLHGNTYVSQVYQLDAASKDTMNVYLSAGISGVSVTEADCNVPETDYPGAMTECKYYGLDWNSFSSSNFKVVGQKYSDSNGVPLSYSDYQTLLQKRMGN